MNEGTVPQSRTAILIFICTLIECVLMHGVFGRGGGEGCVRIPIPLMHDSHELNCSKARSSQAMPTFGL